jgi:hypothetical protein
VSTHRGVRPQRNPNWREALKLATQRNNETMRDPVARIAKYHRLAKSNNQRRPFTV